MSPTAGWLRPATKAAESRELVAGSFVTPIFQTECYFFTFGLFLTSPLSQ